MSFELEELVEGGTWRPYVAQDVQVRRERGACWRCLLAELLQYLSIVFFQRWSSLGCPTYEAENSPSHHSTD